MQAERGLKVQGQVSGRTEQLTPHIALLTLVFWRRLLYYEHENILRYIQLLRYTQG